MTAIHENAKHEIAKFSAFKIDLGNEELNKTSLTIKGSLVEQHITRFNVKKAAIEKASAMLEGDFADMLKHYLIDARSTVFGFIALEEAIAELTKDSWKALIRDVGIYDVMPDKRRDEWDQQKEWVDFTLENVKDTLFVLLSEQGKFTAEKVDNCFNSLSKSHVTNTPAGFYKRCIFPLSYCKGVIHDLRYVIAKLTGRNTNDFGYYDTRWLLDKIPTDGQWREIDGGAWKIRRYQVGTAHVSFHEDIAWQLNSILATIHSAAIPESFRRKPVKAKKKAKSIELVQDLIPFEVLRLFGDLKPATERKSNNRYAGMRDIEISQTHSPCMGSMMLISIGSSSSMHL